MNRESFSKFFNAVLKFAEVDEDTMMSKSLKIVHIIIKIKKKMHEINDDYLHELDILNQMKSKKYIYYKNNSNEELSVKEIEKYYIMTNDEIREQKHKVDVLKYQTDELENLTKDLNTLGFHIKNTIEIKKFFEGN